MGQHPGFGTLRSHCGPLWCGRPSELGWLIVIQQSVPLTNSNGCCYCCREQRPLPHSISVASEHQRASAPVRRLGKSGNSSFKTRCYDWRERCRCNDVLVAKRLWFCPFCLSLSRSTGLSGPAESAISGLRDGQKICPTSTARGGGGDGPKAASQY